MPIDDDEARLRVKAVRLAYCERQNDRLEPAKDFAARLGIEATTWNNFERKGRPGLDNAVKLVEKFGLSLDYIYLGDTEGLSSHKQRELQAAEAMARRQDSQETSEPPTRARTGRPSRLGAVLRSSSKRASTKSRA